MRAIKFSDVTMSREALVQRVIPRPPPPKPAAPPAPAIPQGK